MREGRRGAFEPVQQLERNVLEGPANGCVWQFVKWKTEIAVPGELGIERDGPETGELQGVTVAALVRRDVRPDPGEVDWCAVSKDAAKSGLIASQSRQ